MSQLSDGQSIGRTCSGLPVLPSPPQKPDFPTVDDAIIHLSLTTLHTALENLDLLGRALMLVRQKGRQNLSNSHLVLMQHTHLSSNVSICAYDCWDFEVSKFLARAYLQDGNLALSMDLEGMLAGTVSV